MPTVDLPYTPDRFEVVIANEAYELLDAIQ
jgi:hypothetical protein